MNAELPPFKNGEHNSESESTIDRVIPPLNVEKTTETRNRCLPTQMEQLCRLYPLIGEQWSKWKK